MVLCDRTCGEGEQILTNCKCYMHRIRCAGFYGRLGGKMDYNTGRGYIYFVREAIEAVWKEELA